jgi:hypothetical protein
LQIVISTFVILITEFLPKVFFKFMPILWLRFLLSQHSYFTSFSIW